MWGLAALSGVLALGVGAVATALHRVRLAEIARDRLAESAQTAEQEQPAVPHVSPLTRRHRWLVFAAGVLVAGTLFWGIGWAWPYASALGVMAVLIGWQVEEWFFFRRLGRAEQQLADSIDMMVAAVKSGASLQGAMDSAMENTSRPWKGELQEVVGRIRYGDDPAEVLAELSERLPLETVRLFAQTVAVNWTVGGRLAQTLATVGRTIRDRLELSRRMHAMTTQARLSVISVMLVTYFIAALMWRNDPERMSAFVRSFVGQAMIATAMVLQAAGVVWISRLSKPRF